jgi:hypothetical protein
MDQDGAAYDLRVTLIGGAVLEGPLTLLDDDYIVMDAYVRDDDGTEEICRTVVDMAAIAAVSARFL